jgi:hypothetical protein
MTTEKPTLPNLFIPGAGKSGTTSLHAYLAEHPDIFMCTPKETEFFSHDPVYQRGLDWYSGLFEPGASAQVRGESSTAYFSFPNVIDRLGSACPDARFIFVLRNPIERVWSHYRWLKGRGDESRDLRAAFLADAGQDPHWWEDVNGAYRFYESESRYDDHIGRFLERFGRPRLHVVTTEQLRDDPQAVLASCADFLGLDPPPVVQARHENMSFSTTHDRLDRFISGRPTGRTSIDVLQNAIRRPARWALRSRAVSRRRESALAVIRRDVPDLAPKDRAWLREVFTPGVRRLRALLDLEFADWAADFPVTERRLTAGSEPEEAGR